MGTFTINTGAKENSAPTSIGSLIIDIDHQEEYTFTKDNFTTETNPSYYDPENDIPEYILIKTIPDKGRLLLGIDVVSVNQSIPYDDIPLLKYKASSDVLSNENRIDFDISDVGSGLFSGLETGYILFKVRSKENLPPSIVGDNELDLNYGEVVIFTKEMFTTNTTPPYEDPENDIPKELLISTLPANGKLIYKNNLCKVNQYIPFKDIDSGLLRFIPELKLTNNNSISFIFGISDIGSGDIKI